MRRFLWLLLLLLPFAVSAQTLTPNVGMQLPLPHQQNWQVPVDYNFTLLDTLLGGSQILPMGATPAINGAYDNWITANTVNTTITNITGGFPGQTIHLICGDVHTSISSNANLVVGSGTFSCANGPGVTLTLIGSVWYAVGTGSITGTAGANQALSNLNVTAINQDLLPASNGSNSLGSAADNWLAVHAYALSLYNAGTLATDTLGTDANGLHFNFSANAGKTGYIPAMQMFGGGFPTCGTGEFFLPSPVNNNPTGLLQYCGNDNTYHYAGVTAPDTIPFSYTVMSNATITAGQFVIISGYSATFLQPLYSPAPISTTSGVSGVALTGTTGSLQGFLLVPVGQIQALLDNSCSGVMSVISSTTTLGEGHCTTTPGTNQVLGTEAGTSSGGLTPIWATMGATIGPGGGGGGTPGGSDTQLQINKSGTFSGTSGLSVDNSTTPTTLNLGLDLNSSGPDPWVDIRSGGARSGSISTTGTGSGTSLTVGVATFKNGDGISVLANTVSLTPINTPSVTPSEAASETTMESPTVPGNTGATTYNYIVIPYDGVSGHPAAGASTQITTGAASLGEQSCPITSESLTGSTLTFNACTGLVAGARVHIVPTANSNYLSGEFVISSISSGTATVNNVQVPAPTGLTVTASGGNEYWMAANKITWSAEAGTSYYGVCRSTDGGITYTLIGYSMPVGTPGDFASTTFNDWGPGISRIITYNWGTSNSDCTAASASPGIFTTTVQSGGGTTNLTLAVSLPQAVTSAAVRLDAAPGIRAACVSAQTLNSNGGSACYVPNGFFTVNSPLTIPNNVTLYQTGTITFNEPIIFPIGSNWEPWGKAPNYQPQFGFHNGPKASCNVDYCIQLQGVNTVGSFLIARADNTAAVLAYAPTSIGTNYGPVFEDTTIYNASGVSGTDQAGIGLIGYDTVGLAFRGDVYIAGQYSTGDQTWFPDVYFPPGTFHTGWVEGDGILTVGSHGIFDNLVGSAGDSWLLKTIYRNTVGANPLVEIKAGSSGSQTYYFSGCVQSDTDPLAHFEFIGSGGKFSAPCMGAVSVDAGGRPNALTGENAGALAVAVFPITTPAGLSTIPGSLNQAITNLYNPLLVIPNTPTLSAGGAVNTGTLTLCIQAFDALGNGGPCGPSTSINVTTGNQTVTITWTGVQGASGYEVWNPNALANNGSIIHNTTYTFSSNLSCCASAGPSGPAGSVSLLLSGLITPSLSITSILNGSGYSYKTTLSSPTLTANRTITLPDANVRMMPWDGLGFFTPDLPLESGGAAAGLSGTGACATLTTQKGGSWSGQATCTGTTGASTFVITPGGTATNGFRCDGSDTTSGDELNGVQSGISTTTCTLKFTSVTANDIVAFRVTAY